MRIAFILSLLALLPLQAGPAEGLPEFTATDASAWINSAPLRIADLGGKVVLLEFWAFDCHNCSRSAPWLNSLRQKWPNASFVVVGVHTPEFEHEKDRKNLERSMRRQGVRHAVMMDNDYAYWRSLNNRYWPAFYLADKQGVIRGVFIGETHAGDAQAREIEKQIAELLTR
ncbi:MAG: redoxin domain-containing protein [Turneriella sp.]